MTGKHDKPGSMTKRIKDLESQLQEAQLQSEVHKLRIKQLQKDRLTLEKRLADHQRFGQALLLLMRAVDNVVTARIEHLHVAKTSTIKPNGVTVNYDTSSPDRLLASIREGDMRMYYSQRRKSAAQKFYVYHAVMGAYKATRRVVGTILKPLRKKGKKRDEDEKN